MMMKNFINKILNVPKLIRRIWLLLWILLAILLVMKFCFGIWYPVVSNNEVFNNICKFIDDRKWIYQIICFILYLLSVNVIALTCLNKKKYSNVRNMILLNILICAMSITKIANSLIGNFLEILVFFPLMILLNVKFKNFDRMWKNIVIPIMIYGILNLWQLTIYLCRGLNLQELNSMSSLILLILQIDYYVFLTINWMEVSFMGWASIGWLWTKDITVLKSYKQKELAKRNPDMNLVSKIDARIEKMEKEGK